MCPWTATHRVRQEIDTHIGVASRREQANQLVVQVPYDKNPFTDIYAA
jgi:hypothetical protein